MTALAFGESSSVLVVAGLGAARGSVVVLRDGKVAASSKADADYPFRLAVDPSHSGVAS